MIPSAYADVLSKTHSLPDFLRRTLRLVVIIGGLPFFLFPPAAGAAETKTLHIACGGGWVAQLTPAGNFRTNAVDTTGRRTVTFETFGWSCTIDNAAAHLGEIRSAMRTQEIDAGCDQTMRIVPAGSSNGISLPLPGNVSATVNSTDARAQPRWSHDDIAHLADRGQAHLIRVQEARYFDPGFPGQLVAGAVVFFSAGNGGSTPTAVIYAWSNSAQQYDRAAELTDLTAANVSDYRNQNRLMAYMGANLRLPSLIPVDGADPALDLLTDAAGFYRALESGVGQCNVASGSHEEIAQCANDGNAILLASSSAQTWNPQYSDARVVGAVALSGNFYGQVLLYSAEQAKYIPAPSMQGLQSSLCRTCFRRYDTQRILHTAMRPSFEAAPPAVDTSMTTDTARVITETAPAPQPIEPSTSYQEPWTWARFWRKLGWAGPVLVAIVSILALIMLVALIGAWSRAARIARERRRLARIENIEGFVDEKMREINRAKRQLEREMRDLANEQ